MGQHPQKHADEPQPMQPGYPLPPVQPGVSTPPPVRPGSGSISPGQIPPAQMGNMPATVPHAYPGYQHNLAAAQGYPGYQLPSNDLAPALPAIQASSFPGYYEQPVEPIILPPPQPPQPRRAGKVIWLIILILVLIVVGLAGYILYTRYL